MTAVEQLSLGTNGLHAELCQAGWAWLMGSQRHLVAAIEVGAHGGGATEIADVWGWSPNGSTLIEVKVSRSDFLADKKKPHRLLSNNGMGRHRYFLTPKGLISPDELPDGWGLLEPLRRGAMKRLKRSSAFDLNPAGWFKEQRVLANLIRDAQMVLMARRTPYFVREAERNESELCDGHHCGINTEHTVFDHIYTGNGYRLARIR